MTWNVPPTNTSVVKKGLKLFQVDQKSPTFHSSTAAHGRNNWTHLFILNNNIKTSMFDRRGAFNARAVQLCGSVSHEDWW